MHIHPPVDPLFRVGEIGLGYDAENDLLVLVVREVVAEGAEARRGWRGTLLVHPFSTARHGSLGDGSGLTRPPALPAVR